MPTKHEAAEICAYIEMLSQERWLGDKRKWWPRRLIHFTDINNAVEILTQGELVCRETLATKTGIPLDTADPEIISATSKGVIDQVRLYFRPRPPMLYRVEGFKPNLENTHCPVPIVLTFDSRLILSLPDARFSDGNLRSNQSTIFSTAEEFKKLPFRMIYHDSAFNQDERDQIIFHRHAEVIIPKRLPLAGLLNKIWCRSQAELDTLRELLPNKTWNIYRKKIGLNPRYSLFNEEWTFVDTVEMTANRIKINFHPALKAIDRGPFDVRVEIRPINGGGTTYFSEKRTTCEEPMVVGLGQVPYAEYIARCTIDGHLAYQDRYFDFDLF